MSSKQGIRHLDYCCVL